MMEISFITGFVFCCLMGCFGKTAFKGETKIPCVRLVSEEFDGMTRFFVATDRSEVPSRAIAVVASGESF